VVFDSIVILLCTTFILYAYHITGGHEWACLGWCYIYDSLDCDLRTWAKSWLFSSLDGRRVKRYPWSISNVEMEWRMSSHRLAGRSHRPAIGWSSTIKFCIRKTRWI